jgi:Aspartyl protease
VKFAYLPLPVRQAVPALGGAKARYRLIVPIHILAPLLLPPVDACIDSAADDTVFPPQLATRLGIDPHAAKTGQAQGIGGTIVTVNYALVTLLLSDGYETCEWDAVVGFSTVPMRWALLGHAGFLEFFDVQLLGARREAIVVPNTAFPGQRIIHATPVP